MGKPCALFFNIYVSFMTVMCAFVCKKRAKDTSLPVFSVTLRTLSGVHRPFDGAEIIPSYLNRVMPA